MKTILGILAFFILTFQANAQVFDPNKSFSDIVIEKEAYFAKQRKLYGEDALTAEGGEYNEYRRWYDFWISRIAPNSSMNEYYARISDPAIVPSLKAAGNVDDWYELGPIDKPVAGINDIGNGGSDRGIGIINSLFIHPNNPNKLLGNSRAGGLFYSSDKGQNWTNAGSDKWAGSGCGAMAFAPNNETTWYAGSTLGGSFYSPPIGSGGGVYRTDNAGLVWALIADKYDFDPNPSIGETVTINSIKIDPSNPNVGYVGTNIGLFKSTNINHVTPSMVTWTKLLSDHIEDIEFKLDGSSIVFITRKNTSDIWSIAVTTNGGTTWNSLPGYTFSSATKQIVIEVSQNNTNLIWAMDRASTSTLRIHNYIAGTWVMQPNVFANQVGAGHGLGVSHFNANIIYASNYDRFMKSTDGGATFTTITMSVGAPATRYHADVEDIVTPFALCPTCGGSSNEVYVATHGGVNYSNDNVATLVTRSKGLGIAKITKPSNAALSPEQISMGLDHDGTVLSYGVFGQNWIPGWKTIYGGDGGNTQIDYSNSDILWYEPQVSATKVSVDRGLNTQNSNFPPSNDFYTEMIQNQTFPKILYSKARAGGSSTQYEEVYRSNNSGLVGSITEQISDFQIQPTPLPMGQWVWGIHPARTNPNYLYANVNANSPTWVGHFYRTTDALNASATAVKSSWVELPVPSNGNVKAVDVRNENIVYFSAGGQPWDPNLRLLIVDYTNIGTALSTMVDISGSPGTGGLPDIPINSLVMELGSNGGIYVSTDIGVFYANNTTIIPNGTCVWTELGTNLPHIPLGMLEINYVGNKIRVGTPGRGIWEHDLWCPTTASAYYTGAQTGTQYLEVYNGITSTASVTTNAKITYRAGTSIMLNPGFIAVPSGKGAGYFEGFIHGCSYVGSSPNLKNNEEIENSNTTVSEIPMDAEESDIIAYPNPTEGKFTVNITNDHLYDVNVYSPTGTLMMTINQTRVNKLELDLSMFQTGIYFVRCSNANDFKSITILKK